MPPWLLPAILGVGTVASISAQNKAGKASEREAKIRENEYRIDKKMGKAAAYQRHSDRLRELNDANNSNEALLLGFNNREITNVAAFFKAQEDIAKQDIKNIDFMMDIEASKRDVQGAAARAQGKSASSIAKANMISTAMSGISSYLMYKYPIS